MITLKNFCTAHERLLLLLLLCLAAGFFSLHATAPLYDYDEATYAKVTVDTLASGNVLNLTLSGHAWHEKPPLYFWFSMGAVKMFGPQEFAFRLPGIIASLVCLLLVYLITKKLTGDIISAGVAFLVLLFTPPFYSIAIEGQLDSSVLMCMLAVVYFWLRGQSCTKYLFLLFPVVAVGFLYKSVIILLAVPILLIFSACYRQWSWLKNKYLWFGIIPFLFIIVPWHLLETIRFGIHFWDTYIVWNVFKRATSTITGTFGYGDFIVLMFKYCFWWTLALLASIVIYTMVQLRTAYQVSVKPWRNMLAPLGSAIFILGFFSLMKTHLPPYILPMFPFIALFIGMQFDQLSMRRGIFPNLALFLVSFLIVAGIYYFWTPQFAVPIQTTPDEATAGKLYRAQQELAPLYAIGWPSLETLNYYAGTTTMYREPELTPEAVIRGPLYAVMLVENLPIIFYKDTHGEWKCKYGDLTILYQGPVLMLVYSSGNYPQL